MVRPDPRYGETISLSSQTIKILNDIQNGLISVPDWFNNNIAWMETGTITPQEFLDSYSYLSNQGTIHARIEEPIIEHRKNIKKLTPGDYNTIGAIIDIFGPPKIIRFLI